VDGAIPLLPLNAIMAQTATIIP